MLRSFGRFSALLCTTFSLSVLGDKVVTITQSDYARALTRQAIVSQIQEHPRNLVAPIVMDHMMQLNDKFRAHLMNPSAESMRHLFDRALQEADRRVQVLEGSRRHESLPTEAEYMAEGYAAFKAVLPPAWKPYADALGSGAKLAKRGVDDFRASSIRGQYQSEFMGVLPHVEDVVTRFLDTAKYEQNAPLREGFNLSALSFRLRAKVGWTAEQILQANPKLAENTTLKEVREILKTAYDPRTGTFRIDERSMKEIAKNVKDRLISAARSETKRAIVAADKKTLPTPREQITYRAEPERRASALLASREFVSEATAGVGLMSTFLGFFDKSVAHTFHVVGNSTIQITTSISQFIEGGIGALAMSYNVAGAVMAVMNMIMGGPSPEQLILEQIAELRKQVQELGRGLHAHLDRIDQKLDRLFLAMEEQFGKLNLKVDEIGHQLHSVQSFLTDLENRMTSDRAATYELLKAAAERENVRNANRCLDRAIPPRDEHEFEGCLIDFTTMALDHAADPISAGEYVSLQGILSERQFYLGTVKPLLDRTPDPWLIVNPLMQISATWFGTGPAPTSQKWVNPFLWNKYSLGFVTYLIKNASLLQGAHVEKNLERTNKLLAAGTRLEEALLAAATEITGKDPLLKNLMARSQETAKSFSKALESARIVSQNTHVEGYDINKGWHQPLTSTPKSLAPTKIPYCGGLIRTSPDGPFKLAERSKGGAPELNVPPQMVEKLVPHELRMAHQLGIEGKRVEICYYKVDFENRRRTFVHPRYHREYPWESLKRVWEKETPTGTRETYAHEYAQMYVSIKASWKSSIFFRRRVRFPERLIEKYLIYKDGRPEISFDSWKEGPDVVLEGYWNTGGREAFMDESSSNVTTMHRPPAQLIERLRGQIDTHLKTTKLVDVNRDMMKAATSEGDPVKVSLDTLTEIHRLIDSFAVLLHPDLMESDFRKFIVGKEKYPDRGAFLRAGSEGFFKFLPLPASETDATTYLGVPIVEAHNAAMGDLEELRTRHYIYNKPSVTPAVSETLSRLKALRTLITTDHAAVVVP